MLALRPWPAPTGGHAGEAGGDIGAAARVPVSTCVVVMAHLLMSLSLALPLPP